MKGYVYTMYKGADPGAGWVMTDPIITAIPTLGACMPNIRRALQVGDHIVSVSGRVPNTSPFIVSAFSVAEKITALEAYDRFPENRMRLERDGTLRGNIIIDGNGNHLTIDYHSNFEKRLANYIVGKDPVVLSTPSEIARGRSQTIPFLSDLLEKPGTRLIDIIGRWKKLNTSQVDRLLDWMKSLKDNEGVA